MNFYDLAHNETNDQFVIFSVSGFSDAPLPYLVRQTVEQLVAPMTRCRMLKSKGDACKPVKPITGPIS